MAFLSLGLLLPIGVIVLVLIANQLGLASKDFTGITLGASLGTAVITMVIMMVHIYGELDKRFAGFAQTLGGTIRRNAWGGRIVCLPHPRGRIEVEYCTLGGSKYTSGVHYTRVTLLCGAGELPAESHVLTYAAEARSLQPAAANEVSALFSLFDRPTRVHLVGTEPEPSVQVWVPTWLEDAETLKVVLESARPHLEALAQGPWRA